MRGGVCILISVLQIIVLTALPERARASEAVAAESSVAPAVAAGGWVSLLQRSLTEDGYTRHFGK